MIQKINAVQGRICKHVKITVVLLCSLCFTDGIIDKAFICTDAAEVLLIRKNFVLAVAKCNKQLIFLPTQVHENNYFGIADMYKKFVGEKVKILIYR